MNHTCSRLLLAALIAASSTLAIAQPAQQGRTRDPAVMQQRMTERHEKHMADLKAKLNITPEQEAAWTSFATAMKPSAPPTRVSRDELNSMTTPQRIELRQKRMAERQERIKQHDEATNAFYATLTPEQQKTFDQHVTRTARQVKHRAIKRVPKQS